MGVSEIVVELTRGASLRVCLLPGRGAGSGPPLLLEPTHPGGAVGVLEGEEYVFEVEGAALARGEPKAVWQVDSESGLRGRLRPGLFVGTLPLRLVVDGAPAEVLLEVRSRKLDASTQYRWMVRDLIAAFAEAVMRSFGISAQPFSGEGPGEVGALYPRFAYLESMLEGGHLQAAMAQVLARPHAAWESEEEPRRPGQGVRAGADISRQLQRRGARQPAPGMPSGTLPRALHERRPRETHDTPPNRYVRTLLERWRGLVDAVEAELPAEATSSRRACARVRGVLRGWLGAPLFRTVSRGGEAAVRHDNQALQKRAGYRQLFEAGQRMELASRLAWPGSEVVFRAGIRDVAQLYEFWCYLELARTLSELCAQPLALDALVERRMGGLELRLRRGAESVLRGGLERAGRRLEVALFYNRGFHVGAGSWSRALRPDFSVRFQISTPGAERGLPPLWLHFDAKYRLEAFPGGEGGAAARDDLLKMHAYRDAIHRSAGAYVLYPGTEVLNYRSGPELLPGLGAFPLAPLSSGRASAGAALSTFLDAVVEHLVSQDTHHERARFWSWRVHSAPPPASSGAPAAPFLRRPPADTSVLLGWIKGAAHGAWILAQRRYNLRADRRRGRVRVGGPVLAADIAVLYDVASGAVQVWRVDGAEVEVWTAAELEAEGYPEPGGASYFLLPLEAVETGAWEGLLEAKAVAALARRLAPEAPRGAPVVTTWEALAGVRVT